MNLSVQWDIKDLLQAADRMAVQKHLPEFGAVVLKKKARIKLSERKGTHITTAEPRKKLKLSDIRRK